MKKYIAILLIILGVIMIGLSIKGTALPPGITGIGFIAIAVVFLRKET
jgi:drug/metabolite transporter (DMT)-like permease